MRRKRGVGWGKGLLVGVLVHGAGAGGAEVIDRFDFNSPVNDGDPGTGTFLSWGQFGLNGWGQNTRGVIVDGAGSSDGNVTDNSAFGMVGFSTSPQGADRTEGFGFSVNFPGFEEIRLTLDIQFTVGSVDRLQAQYFGLGGVWEDFGVVVSEGPGWMNGVELDFSGLSFANNNPGFQMRLVRRHASEAGFQGTGGGVYEGGMIAFDNVVWTGVAIVPEPGAPWLLGCGLGAMGWRGWVVRRRRVVCGGGG